MIIKNYPSIGITTYYSGEQEQLAFLCVSPLRQVRARDQLSYFDCTSDAGCNSNGNYCCRLRQSTARDVSECKSGLLSAASQLGWNSFRVRANTVPERRPRSRSIARQRVVKQRIDLGLLGNFHTGRFFFGQSPGVTQDRAPPSKMSSRAVLFACSSNRANNSAKIRLLRGTFFAARQKFPIGVKQKYRSRDE